MYGQLTRSETMTCAVVEHQDGSKTHHTNVVNSSVGMCRQKPYVKLLLTDSSTETIKDSIAVQLVEDDWYARTQLGVNA